MLVTLDLDPKILPQISNQDAGLHLLVNSEIASPEGTVAS